MGPALPQRRSITGRPALDARAVPGTDNRGRRRQGEGHAAVQGCPTAAPQQASSSAGRQGSYSSGPALDQFHCPVRVFARTDTPENETILQKKDEVKTSLQKDLDELVKWSETWQLKFHPEKCSFMKLGPYRNT